MQIDFFNSIKKKGIIFIVSTLDNFVELSPKQVVDYLRVAQNAEAEKNAIALEIDVEKVMKYMDYMSNADRCNGITKNGERCRNVTFPISNVITEYDGRPGEYCKIHKKQSDYE